MKIVLQLRIAMGFLPATRIVTRIAARHAAARPSFTTNLPTREMHTLCRMKII